MSQETTLQVIQPSNPLEVLALIDVKSCEQYAREITALVKEGHADPIQVRVLMSAWEKAFKSIKTAIEPETEREAMKHGAKFDFLGTKCEWVPVFTEYDYSRDTDWGTLKADVEAAVAKQKERETFLKALDKPFERVENDEVITVYPAVKKQREGLKVTIK